MAKQYWSSHPSIVDENDIVTSKPRLKVFAYLKADRTLPKYLIDGMVVLKNKKPMTIEEYIHSSDGMSSYRMNQYSKSVSKSRGLSEGEKRNVFQTCTDYIKSLFGKNAEPSQIPPETFKTACDMIKEKRISTDIDTTAVKLKALIDKTMKNGQTALANRLMNEHQNLLYESVLVKNGLFHYITEEDVINLLKMADFGIRIDFWNDYAEIAPDDVIEAKQKADALRVFDNWCVMHYDPTGESLKQMKTEEWTRDPILFGMILGSDRLYYVKDWKTSKDDLTIQKVCDILNIKEIREARDYGVDSPYSGVIQRVEGNDSESMMDEVVEPNDPDEPSGANT